MLKVKTHLTTKNEATVEIIYHVFFKKIIKKWFSVLLYLSHIFYYSIFYLRNYLKKPLLLLLLHYPKHIFIL